MWLDMGMRDDKPRAVLLTGRRKETGRGAGVLLSVRGLAWRMGGPLGLSTISMRLEGP